jgi:PilZ domain
MQERRNAPRLQTNLNVRWETLHTGGRGTVCDLSTSGCFILTGGEVTPPELVRLNIALSTEMATLWGTIVYAIGEMGFAVRFVFGSDADKDLVQRVITSLP